MSNRFITLTWDFIRDKGTTPHEKFILAEIEALSSLEKGCIAHNEHFAELLGVKKESVSRSINSLKEKGYIDVEIVKGSRNHERKITLNKLLFRGKQNVIEGLTNCLETKGNKTINNTKLYDGIGQNDKKRKSARFVPPTIDECFLYCQSRIEAEKFWHYYESNGWKVGKNKMKNWKSALTGWMKRAESYNQPKEGERKWSDLSEEEQMDLMMKNINLDKETRDYFGMN